MMMNDNDGDGEDESDDDDDLLSFHGKKWRISHKKTQQSLMLTIIQCRL